MLLIFVFVFLFAGCSKTVAKVDGIEIKQKEVDTYINFYKKQSTDGELTQNEDELKTLEAYIIDIIIVTRLLEKYAEENNIAVSSEEVDKQIKLIIDSYPSEEDFEKGLKDMGIDKKFLEDGLRSQLLSSRIYNKVTADVIVTEEEVKKYYEDNKNTLFLVPANDSQEEDIQKFSEVEESINAYLLNLHKDEKSKDFIFSLIEEVNIEYFTDVEGTLNSTDTGTEDSTDTGTEDNTDTGTEEESE